MNPDIVLSARDLTVRFGQMTALDSVDLNVAAGQRVALLGHNGAGKSTFFRAILGFLRPAGGAVCIDGAMPASDAARRAVSYLPETMAFPKALTGAEILSTFLRLRGEDLRQCDMLLDRVGLGDAGGRAVGTYSKGMRQRLGLAQALIGRPRLLLLDEPTSGLDPVSRRDFYTIIDAAAAEGSAVLLSSHGLDEVQGRTDRVAILSRGRLVADGTASALSAQADLPVRLTLRVPPARRDDLAAGLGAQVVAEDALMLTAPVADKAALLARIAPLAADLRDIDLHLPTLEDVYRHFSDRTKGGAV